MIGAIAEAYYGQVDPDIRNKVKTILPDDLWLITEEFCRHYEKG